MNHEFHHSPPVPQFIGHSFKDFLPLVGAFIAVTILTFVLGFLNNAIHYIDWMRFFEGSFFLIFGVVNSQPK